MNSNFFKLNWLDFAKGLILSAISAVVSFLNDLFQAWQVGTPLVIDFTTMWHVALIAGVAYLTKNLFTNSDGKPLTPEVK